ncbi:FTR1 family protein [Paucibacter sp. R3-3]|uniref:FTR1 family protein n=1 Tax=Roseateles agri TaxID=3098619 RepID=A0ABU5DCF9_9BURK|nr:FTR1 family protein [Paucibacter sp. R3-3]MDY0743966.1 FTR1 family protein [Paucibacter sp. R3-3]
MFNAFLVTLREIAELLVIAEGLRAYLRHENQRHRLRQVHVGMISGALLGVGLSTWLIELSWDAMPRAAISAAIGATVLMLATGMLSSVRSLQSKVQDALERWGERTAMPAAIIGVAAFAACRETVELSLFLDATWPVAGTTATLAGAALGVGCAAGLALVYRQIATRVNLLLLFQLSTLILALMATELLLGGLGRWLAIATADDAQGSAVRSIATPFLEGGRWYVGVCMTLMLLPGAAVARAWWRESAIR